MIQGTEKSHVYSFSSKCLYVLSIPSAPIGAVITIAITATDSTSVPQESPAARGTDPIAACTVAFGRYAIIQNTRSFHVSFVPSMQMQTPTARNSKAAPIIKSAITPAFAIYRISTAAPTNTNRITSAAIHSLPNFSDNRFDTNVVLSP